nr:lincomycin resistance protein LmrB [Terrabacter sp. MAHUQ-38]
MRAAEVAEVVDWVVAAGAIYQVNGGWAVDALIARETREHRDLDIFLDSTFVPPLLEWLQGRGYHVTEDWRPVRVELACEHGRVDVHPMEIQDNGDGVQRGLGGQAFIHPARDRTMGVIGGRDVVVACAARLRELRTGFEPRPVDLHDLRALDRL